MAKTPVLTELPFERRNQPRVATLPLPVAEKERIVSIDVLRGFALLGILPMNIQYFSMVSAAYMNPTAYRDLTGANYWVWLLSHVLVALTEPRLRSSRLQSSAFRKGAKCGFPATPSRFFQSLLFSS